MRAFVGERLSVYGRRFLGDRPSVFGGPCIGTFSSGIVLGEVSGLEMATGGVSGTCFLSGTVRVYFNVRSGSKGCDI